MPRKIVQRHIEGAPDIPIINDEPGEIETVAMDKDFDKVARNAAFMEESVVIEIAETTDENAVPYAHLNCNGANQVIPRGMPVSVKRKFVEILARMKETKYKQVHNTVELDRYEMHEKTALVFPFQVIKDDNKLGMPWLKRILAEAA